MKIAILGGAFDPPHIGHELVAKQIKEFLKLDQIWLVPCFKHPFDKHLSSSKHRLNMTKFLENDNIKVSDYEIRQTNYSYSLKTIDHFSGQFPTDSFSWIIGSDQIKDFQRWYHWQELIEKYSLIVFPRKTDLITIEGEVKKYLGFKKLLRHVQIIKKENIVITTVSSTLIRQRVKTDRSIRHLVPEKVEEYIRKNGLYRRQKAKILI